MTPPIASEWYALGKQLFVRYTELWEYPKSSVPDIYLFLHLHSLHKYLHFRNIDLDILTVHISFLVYLNVISFSTDATKLQENQAKIRINPYRDSHRMYSLCKWTCCVCCTASPAKKLIWNYGTIDCINAEQNRRFLICILWCVVIIYRSTFV